MSDGQDRAVPQPPLEPVDPQDATWPVLEEHPFVERETTVVDPAPPAMPPPDRGFGAGLLIGLAILALVAGGIAVAYILTHRSSDTQATTVVVTSAPAVTTSAPPATTTGAAVPQQTATTNAQTATTAATTTAPTTTSAPVPATPASATIPDVAGQTEQAAVTSFSKAGVLPSLFFVPSQDALGTVEGQGKPAGTTVPYHAHVQLNLSRGPGEKPNVSVPDVGGKSLSDAVASLNGAHLRLIYVRFPVTVKSQGGTIVQQSPLAGGQAPENAQVLVFLGAYQR